LATGPTHEDSGLLLADELGRPYHPECISGWFDTKAAEVGLPRIRLHDTRHTAATLMLANGTPVKVVSKVLGHASVTTTLSIYAHVRPGMAQEAGARLSASLLGRGSRSALRRSVDLRPRADHHPSLLGLIAFGLNPDAAKFPVEPVMQLVDAPLHRDLNEVGSQVSSRATENGDNYQLRGADAPVASLFQLLTGALEAFIPWAASQRRCGSFVALVHDTDHRALFAVRSADIPLTWLASVGPGAIR
jgi:hypothetical protein